MFELSISKDMEGKKITMIKGEFQHTSSISSNTKKISVEQGRVVTT